VNCPVGPVGEYISFLNSLQFGSHLKELVLHDVKLDEEEKNNCFVTILRSNPSLTFLGIIDSSLYKHHWLELFDAIRMHPSLACLDLSDCWYESGEYPKDFTDAISHLLMDNPRIEKIYGCNANKCNKTLFRTCIEPKLELNWYRKRVQKLRDICNTSTRDALIGKALAVLDGKPSVRYLLLSEYCNVIVTHVCERYCSGTGERSLKRRRDSLSSRD